MRDRLAESVDGLLAHWSAELRTISLIDPQKPFFIEPAELFHEKSGTELIFLEWDDSGRLLCALFSLGDLKVWSIPEGNHCRATSLSKFWPLLSISWIPTIPKREGKLVRGTPRILPPGTHGLVAFCANCIVVILIFDDGRDLELRSKDVPWLRPNLNITILINLCGPEIFYIPAIIQHSSGKSSIVRLSIELGEELIATMEPVLNIKLPSTATTLFHSCNLIQAVCPISGRSFKVVRLDLLDKKVSEATFEHESDVEHFLWQPESKNIIFTDTEHKVFRIDADEGILPLEAVPFQQFYASKTPLGMKIRAACTSKTGNKVIILFQAQSFPGRLFLALCGDCKESHYETAPPMKEELIRSSKNLNRYLKHLFESCNDTEGFHRDQMRILEQVEERYQAYLSRICLCQACLTEPNSPCRLVVEIPEVAENLRLLSIIHRSQSSSESHFNLPEDSGSRFFNAN